MNSHNRTYIPQYEQSFPVGNSLVPARRCNSPEEDYISRAVSKYRATSLGRESSTSDERAGSPGYENCSGHYIGFSRKKGSFELKPVQISSNGHKSKISLEETQIFIEDQGSDHSGFSLNKKLANGNGVGGSYNTVNGFDKSKYINADKTKSFDHMTLSSTDEYFMTLDQNRFNNLSNGESHSQLNRCRVFSFITICFATILLICTSIILFSFTNIFTCNSRFLCWTEAETTPSQKPHSSASSRLLPNDTSDPWNEPRLPSDIIPLHYDLLLNIDDKREMFYGNVSIEFTAKVFTKYIILHASPKLTFRADPSFIRVVAALNLPLAIVSCSRVRGEPSEELLVVIMESHLTVNERYAINFEFESQLNSKSKEGLYLSWFDDGDNIKRPMIIMNNFPTFARNVFPCFDEPAFRASLSLHVVCDRQFGAVSNMPVKQSYVLDLNERKKLWSFVVAPQAPAYLYSLALFPQDSSKKYVLQGDPLSLERTNIDQQIIALNESSDQVREYRHYREDLESLSYVADTILDISTSTVEYLVSKSNIKVPFLHSKLDFVYSSCAPEKGLISLGLVIIPQMTPHLEFTIARSLVSQLTLNTFSINWWDDLWAMEGLSCFLALDSLQNYITSSEQAQLILHNQMKVAVLMHYSIERGLSLSLSVFHDSSIAEMNSAITGKLNKYKTRTIATVLNPEDQMSRAIKAATVFLSIDYVQPGLALDCVEMMAFKIHENPFQASVNIKNYLMDMQLKLRDSRGFDLHSFLLPWLYASTFPILKLSFDENRSLLLASQQPINKQQLAFKTQPTNSSWFPVKTDLKAYSWNFKTTVMFGTETQADYWINQNYKELTPISLLDNQFVLTAMCGGSMTRGSPLISQPDTQLQSTSSTESTFRAANIAWFLPMYDSNLIQKVKLQLKQNCLKIPEVERYSLIRGYFTLLKNNASPASALLDLIQYAGNETSKDIKFLLGDITQFFLHRFEMRYPYFLKKFFGDIWSSIYETECEPSLLNIDSDICLSVTINHACYFGNEKCLTRTNSVLDRINQQFKYVPSQSTFEKWLEEFLRLRSSEVISATSFCDSIRWSEMYDLSLNLAHSATSTKLRRVLIQGLARNPISVSNLLSNINSGGNFSSEEVLLVLSEAVHFSDGWMVVAHYLTQANGAKINPLIFELAAQSEDDRFCSQFLRKFSLFITQTADLEDFARIVNIFVGKGCSCCTKSDFFNHLVNHQINSQIAWYNSNDNSTNYFFNQLYFV